MQVRVLLTTKSFFGAVAQSVERRVRSAVTTERSRPVPRGYRPIVGRQAGSLEMLVRIQLVPPINTGSRV